MAAAIDRKTLLQHCLRVVGDQLDVGIERSARGVYYDLVGEGIIEQDRPDANGNPTRKNYRRVLDTIAKAKLAGDFPLEWLRDDLRPVREGEVSKATVDVDDAIDEVEDYLRWLPKHLIRADHWYEQPIIPLVIAEKDTLVGTIRGPCDDLHVPWYVCRGYSSLTGLFALAEYVHGIQQACEWEHTVEVLYLGDHDPEGLNIPETVRTRLGQLYAIKGWPDPPQSFRRVALTKAQALAIGAPPMPVKTSSSRSAGYIERYGNEAWEIEAMPSLRLQQLLRSTIEDVYDDQVRARVVGQFPDLRQQVKDRIIADGGQLAARAYEGRS